MTLEELKRDWEPRIVRFISEQPGGDPGHGLVHLRRVVGTAVALVAAEDARLDIVWPAAWLHDFEHEPAVPEWQHQQRPDDCLDGDVGRQLHQPVEPQPLPRCCRVVRSSGG